MNAAAAASTTASSSAASHFSEHHNSMEYAHPPFILPRKFIKIDAVYKCYKFMDVHEHE